MRSTAGCEAQVTTDQHARPWARLGLLGEKAVDITVSTGGSPAGGRRASSPRGAEDPFKGLLSRRVRLDART